MAYTRNTGEGPLFLQLFDDLDCLQCGHQERAKNVLELAKLAANKAFADAGTWHEERRIYREDAIQEAATIILEYADMGPRIAYWRARKRLITWIILVIYQGKPRRHPGERTIPRIECSLDEFDYESLWIHQYNPLGSPEEALAEEEAFRECCIETMYEVIYDLIANQMELNRRHRYTARKDAEIFQYTLRGYGTAAIMHELGIAERTANQRVQLARKRLEQLMAERGLEAVASRYSNIANQPLNHRKVRSFVAEAVKKRSAAHLQQYGRPPAKRTVHTWTKEAYTAWAAR